MKLVWRVSPEPTGTYQSFDKRAWPDAFFNSADGNIASSIYADKEYKPMYSKVNDVGFDLTVRVTITIDNKWEWRTLKKRARSIKEAKELALSFYKENPNYVR